MGLQSLVLSPLGAWTVGTYVDLERDRAEESDTAGGSDASAP